MAITQHARLGRVLVFVVVVDGREERKKIGIIKISDEIL